MPKYSTKLAERICERIAAGERLEAILQGRTMPSRATYYRWLREHEGFRAMRWAAREQYADFVHEEIRKLEDRLDGQGDLGRIRAIETQIRSKQFRMKRLGRSEWGDRADVAVAHADVGNASADVDSEELSSQLQQFCLNYPDSAMCRELDPELYDWNQERARLRDEPLRVGSANST